MGLLHGIDGVITPEPPEETPRSEHDADSGRTRTGSSTEERVGNGVPASAGQGGWYRGAPVGPEPRPFGFELNPRTKDHRERVPPRCPPGRPARARARRTGSLGRA